MPYFWNHSYSRINPYSRIHSYARIHPYPRIHLCSRIYPCPQETPFPLNVQGFVFFIFYIKSTHGAGGETTSLRIASWKCSFNKFMIQLEEILNCGIIANVLLTNLKTIDINFNNFIMFKSSCILRCWLWRIESISIL